MTLIEIAIDIRNRANQSGEYPTAPEALRQAAEEVLAGFRHMKTGELDLGEAREHVEIMRLTGNACFTGYGYEVDADTLETAIVWAGLWQEVV